MAAAPPRSGDPSGPDDPAADTAALSLEFFPPDSESGTRSLDRELEALGVLRPRFVSVTCGAGGSTRRLTHETLARVRARVELECAPHMICVGATQADLRAVVRDYLAAGVRHVVALRGDPPRGEGRFQPHPGGYEWAAEFVRDIARLGVAEISVAAYPEVHPEAPSAQADLDNLKRKVDAGATRAITQFFFDADAFLRFRDRARAAGVNVPIVPGILPVASFRRVSAFADRCGARIPPAVARRFAGLDEVPEERARIATEIGAELCLRLRRHGVRGFHFYTMNRSALTVAICRAAELAPHSKSGA